MQPVEAHRPLKLTGIAAAGALAVLMLLALCTWGASAAQAGTLVVTKGGDRNVTSNNFSGTPSYATPLAGAQFEYSSSASGPWTDIPGTTDANGQVSIDLSAGTYYVREKTPAPGFTDFGALQQVNFYGEDEPYVARVQVSTSGTTYAFPQSNGDDNPNNWWPTNGPSGSNNGSPFLDVRDNGTVPNTCGQNILLVLDRSGSIDPYKSSYEAAAKAFVNELNGTPTQIGIISFSDTVNSYSPSQGSSSYYQSPLDLSNPGSAGTLNNTISNIYGNPNGSTNWDGALQAAAQAKGFTANASTGQTTNPDMVVFITDGNPTISEMSSSGGGSTSLSDLSGGIASANLVKTQPSRGNDTVKLLAIGVGSGVTPNNLKVVSGPTQGVDGDYAVPTIPELNSFLKELAATQCGARIYVRKRIAGGDGTNQAGWKYTAVDPRPGKTPTYLDGNNATHLSGGVIQTGAFFTNLPTTPTTVQVNEDATGQPVSNFSLTDVTCRTDGFDSGSTVTGTRSGLNFSLDVSRGDVAYCTYTNALNTTLSITKTPDNQTINAGDDAEFTITVKNTGTNTANTALVSDQLPAPGVGGWTVTQQPAGGSCSVDGSNLLGCTLGNLAPGQTVTLKVKTGTDKDHCGVYDNPIARASASNASEVTDGGRITCQKPSLEVTKTAVSGTITAGDDAQFSITMKNNGPGLAKSATLTDTLPGGTAGPWTIVSQPAGNPCSISGSVLTCNFGNLASGQSRTVTVKAPTSAQACTTYDNTATGSASNAASDSDSATINCQTAGLGILKTAVHATINAGDNAEFTIVTSNTGAGTAKDVTMSDPLPTAGISGPWTITSQPAGNPCSISGNTLTCNFGDMASGASYSVTVSAPTDFDNCSTLPNTATASSTNAPDASDDATIQCQKPNLSVTKTAENATINAGDTARFTIKVANAGPGVAKGVSLDDPLPAGTGGWTIDSQPAGNPCSISGGNLTCANLGDLAAGEDVTIVISAPTSYQNCAVYDNTATAHSTNAPDASDSDTVTCQKPDLEVDKSATSGTINAGEDAEFSITLTNYGPGVAKNATLSDPLPAGTGGWSISSPPSAGTCSITSGTLNCTFGDLPAGTARTVKVKATTSYQNCSTWNNTATGKADNHPNALDDASITCQKPSLEVTKTAANATINAGDDAVFSITLKNNGPGVAKDATLSDSLPGGTAGDWVIDPADPDCSITAGILACSFGDLASGQSRTVTVKAPTSNQACTTYDNTATGSASNAPNASDGAIITCEKPSLSITKTAADDSVDAGDDIQFTVKVSNAGPGTANNVKVTDTLPGGTQGDWSIVSQPSGDPCSITAGVLTCDFGSLAAGQDRTVTIQAGTGYDACTIYNNTASVSSDNAGSDEASARITCSKPDLGVLKTAVSGTINAGENAEFTIVTSNTGDGVAKGVQMTDPLPTGVSGPWTITSQPAGNPCSISGNTLTCNFGDMAKGASYSVTVSAPTDFENCTTLDNTATATATNAPDASDDASINCQKPDLTVTKTAENATINAGDTARFTIKVANAGPGVAKAVTLDDPLPAGAGGWTIASQPAGNPCSITAGTLNCSFGDMAAGTDATVVITATTSYEDCTVYDNTATAHSTNAPDASDSDTITCQKPALTLKKTTPSPTVNAGEDVKFSMTVTNNGPGVAKDATLTDTLPTGVQGSWTMDPANPDCSITAGVLDCDFGDLASGDSRTVTVKASTSDENCTTYDNTATASSTNGPDASDEASVTCQKAGLGILKTAVHATINAGDNAEFTIVTSNTGAGTAKDVTMSDSLPTGVSGPWTITDQPAGNPCSITAGTLNCDFGDMGSGASYSVTVSAPTDFESCTTLDNTATATSSNAPDASDDATIQCQKPNLSVTKTADQASVSAGDEIGFTITVSNAGPGTAKAVTLNDPLPTGTDGDWTIASQPAGDPCSITAGVLSCDFGDMAAESSAQVKIKASTSYEDCTAYDNTATASSTNAPDASDEARVLCQKPEVATLKTAVQGTISAGDNAEFTIKVSNNGAGTAKGVTLDDPLPTGVSGPWTITDQPAGDPCSISGGSLVCDFGDLPGGESREVTVSAPTDFENCSTLENEATASSDNAPDASGSANIECQKPNLTVEKNGNGTVNAGEDVEFTITVTNSGPGVARNVTLSDSVPSGVADAWTISSQPSGDPCAIAAGVLNCDFGDMDAGTSYTVTITAPTNYGHCATYDNTATASATNSPDATGSDSVDCLKPNVNIVKDGNGRTGVGRNVSFTIKVTNTGPGTAHGVVVDDPLSDLAGPWSIGSQSEGANCEIVNGGLQPAGAEGSPRLICQVGDLEPGETITATVRAKMNPKVCETVDNIATVTSENAPEKSDEAKVKCLKPHLQLRKKANKRVVLPGAKVRYTIMVRNNRIGSVATDLEICDRIPRHMNVVRKGSGHFDNGRLCWNIKRLEGSKKWTTFHYVTRVSQAARPRERLRNVVTLGKLKDHWTVRVKRPPVKVKRHHRTPVTG